jgi:hypothetical protein
MVVWLDSANGHSIFPIEVRWGGVKVCTSMSHTLHHPILCLTYTVLGQAKRGAVSLSGCRQLYPLILSFVLPASSSIT